MTSSTIARSSVVHAPAELFGLRSCHAAVSSMKTSSDRCHSVHIGSTASRKSFGLSWSAGGATSDGIAAGSINGARAAADPYSIAAHINAIADELVTTTPAIWLSAGEYDGIVDRKSTRLNSSHVKIAYAVLCLKKHTTD